MNDVTCPAYFNKPLKVQRKRGLAGGRKISVIFLSSLPVLRHNLCPIASYLRSLTKQKPFGRLSVEAFKSINIGMCSATI